ncbi:hypothetical protein FSP39_016791 [Pinctada imbricata]|uniref:Gasdermin pore forming domain-containing protein n=1 Tax=Pinctada imbricata TaxID=66713 RepID=A0AA89BPY0_PINIB|nr:hypothetical protein FSP39_016791 [Pinctada imbricata]
MFHAVCHKFAQAMGPDTLIPVKSMDRATEIRPLNVVVKKTKRKFIFFKKTHFMPYNFQLQDLLMEPQKSLDASIKTFEFCEFNPTSKYSLSGKIGVQIMEELMDAELSASDSVVISSPLGVIEKQDVAPEILLKSLCDRRVNFDHTFVQQVREGSADVLCIVTGVCQVKKDAEIKRVDNIDGEVDLKGKV